MFQGGKYMNKDFLRLLDISESYEEGINLIQANAESIDDEIAEAIFKRYKDFEIGEKRDWSRHWYKVAKGVAFLNKYFGLATEDLEKANDLISTVDLEIAHSATNIILSQIKSFYDPLSRILSEANSLATNLGVDAAQDTKKKFEEENNLAKECIRIANIFAEKSQNDDLRAEILLWEGIFTLLEHDLSDTFDKNKMKDLSDKAKGNFENVLTLSQDFSTKIICLSNLAKSWYDEDLNKSLNYLSQAKTELNGRKRQAKTEEEKVYLEELEIQQTKDLSHLFQKLNRFEDSYNILISAIDASEKKLWSLAAPNLIAEFLEKNQSLYVNMVNTCLELGKKEHEFNKKALEYAEMINARLFLDTWRTLSSSGTGANPELLNRRKRLLDEFYYLGINPSDEEINRLKEIQIEIGIVEQEIWKQSKIKIFFNEARPAKFDEIVRVVPQNGILVEYFVTSDKIFVFVVDDKVLDVIELNFDRSNLWQIIVMANIAIGCRLNYTTYNELEKKGIRLPWTELRNLNFLYKLLIEPISSYLMDKEVLYLIPHSELRNVPFQALYREIEDEKKYLIEDIAISYAPSISILRLLRQRERSLKTCFSAGVHENKGGTKKALEEAQMVADFFNTKAHPGTKEAFLSEAADYDMNHISCHSTDSSVVSIYNGLILEDGVLLPQDIRDIKCSLVTLSACKTYSDDVSNTRELAGLTGSFLKAGARSVVASLWPVHDTATYMLMEEFYRNLSRGEKKAKALQKAQIKVKKEFSSHPLFWAPFFLVGAHD